MFTENTAKCPYLQLMATLKETPKRLDVDHSTQKSPTPKKIKPKLPPGPTSLPFIGSTLAYLIDPIGFLTRNARTYGDIFSFKMRGRINIHLNSPEFIHQVLVRDYEHFEKSDVGVLIGNKRILGNGLLTCSNHDHKIQRRLIQPSFSTSNLMKYGTDIPFLTTRFFQFLKDGHSLNLSQNLDKLTLYILIHTLFGAQQKSALDTIPKATEEINKLTSPIHLYLALNWPTYLTNPYHRNHEEHRRLFEKEINGLLQNQTENPTNLISKLAESLLMGGQPNKKEFIDHIITLLLAGHETTGTTLAWILMLLSQHPAWQDKFIHEIDIVYKGNVPTVDKLSDLKITTMIIKESMRLYPAAWALTRKAMRDTTIGSYDVPAGSIVGFSQSVMHRDPRYFPDPNRFDPLRWTAQEEKKRPEFSYFPFGGGPRACIGAGFAMMEMKLILATLAQKWRFDLIANQKIKLNPLFTLRPHHPIFMTIKRRQQ